MNKQNIEQIIRDLFKDNMKAYPESYPASDVKASTKAAETVATDYRSYRTEDEIERDAAAGVTVDDYKAWVVKELGTYHLFTTRL